MVLNRWQAIIWTDYVLVYWCILESLSLSEFTLRYFTHKIGSRIISASFEKNSITEYELNLLVLNPKYSVVTRSLAWLDMPWWCRWPENWLYRMTILVLYWNNCLPSNGGTLDAGVTLDTTKLSFWATFSATWRRIWWWTCKLKVICNL